MKSFTYKYLKRNESIIMNRLTNQLSSLFFKGLNLIFSVILKY